MDEDSANRCMTAPMLSASDRISLATYPCCARLQGRLFLFHRKETTFEAQLNESSSLVCKRSHFADPKTKLLFK
ncbi:unnamed protein product [Arctogadus glacialis]